MNEREKLIIFSFDEIKKKIVDEKTSIQDSTSFSKLLLDSMPNNKEHIVQYFNKKVDEILPGIVNQNDFVIALKILDLFLLDKTPAGESIIDKMLLNIVTAIRNMPDDVWKIRVMSQLSEEVLKMILPRFSEQELSALLYMCPQVMNSEAIENNIKVIIEEKSTRKKLILRKKVR